VGLFEASTHLSVAEEGGRGGAPVPAEGFLPDAPSELLGDKFQDFRTLAIDVHRCFAHPCSLRLRFRLDCLGYRLAAGLQRAQLFLLSRAADEFHREKCNRYKRILASSVPKLPQLRSVIVRWSTLFRPRLGA
jgi:hypothetical protein